VPRAIRILRAALLAVPLTVVTAAAPQAFAQGASASIEGHVITIEDGEIVIDIATAKGATDGDVVELWRPLKLKHPVTGKVVTDRFRIGSLELTQVRSALALARPKGKLARPAEPGDIVVLRKARAEPAPVTEQEQPGTAPAKPPVAALPTPHVSDLDPDARAVTQIFEALKNAPVPHRIIRYEGFVRENPDSRFAAVLYEEAQQLRRLLKLEQESKSAAEGPELQSFRPPESAIEGMPIELGVEVRGPASGAVLHTRNAGEVAYQPTPMRSAGRGYYVATIPAERMRAPRIEYFIEASTESGRPVPLVSHADSPSRLEVHGIPTPRPPERHEATVNVLADYADYNRLQGNDRVLQVEGYFGMRFRDVGVRALRTGAGVYRGVGGSLEQLDERKMSGRLVGLTYGYLEGEYAFTSFTALVGRGVIGLKDDGVSGGAQAFVRIGNDKKTNLMIGGEVLGGVGFRGITQLELATFERVPILLRTEVTNQPAGVSADPEDVRPAEDSQAGTSTEVGEVGARAIAQVGYELTDGFVVALRGSYQGRTIKHAGPGAGLAVMYTW
jgi:hypothetical protein